MKMNSQTSKQTVERLNAIKDGATVRVEYRRGGYRLVRMTGYFIPESELSGAWGIRVTGVDGDFAGYVFVSKKDRVTVSKDNHITVHLPCGGKPDGAPVTEKQLRMLKDKPVSKRLAWPCGEVPPKIGKGDTLIVVAGENESVSEFDKRMKLAVDLISADEGRLVMNVEKSRHDVRMAYGLVPMPLTKHERIMGYVSKVIR